MKLSPAGKLDQPGLVVMLALLLSLGSSQALSGLQTQKVKSAQVEQPASQGAVSLIPIDQPLVVENQLIKSADHANINANSVDETEHPVANIDEDPNSLQGDDQLGKTVASEFNTMLANQLNAQRAERRFGLLKKGNYGAPMSMPMTALPMMASYTAAGSTDCERCLASMSQQPAWSAEYQQVPLEPPVSPPGGVVPAMPSGYSSPAMHPLKSKLFMKFPFFLKAPMNQPLDYNQPAAHDYWTNQQPMPAPSPPVIIRPQPAQSGALFVRPTHAYNCIQAAPLLAAPNLHQADLVSPAGGGKTSGSAIKQQHFGAQHQQQQVSYPSSAY